MNMRKLILGLAGAAMIAGAATPTLVLAQSAAAKAAVDAGKAAGKIGEQGDGYLGFVGGSDPALASACDLGRAETAGAGLLAGAADVLQAVLGKKA